MQNQSHEIWQKDGVWIDHYSLDSATNQNYKSREVYRLDKPIRTWKYYKNNQLIRKEKYKKDYCVVIFYYENGKIEKTGKTKFDVSEKESHWYYDGKWEFYDLNEKPLKTTYYKDGVAIKTDSVTVKTK